MKNPKMWMLKKLVLVALINKTIFLDAYVKTQSHQFLALEILPRVMLPVFRFQAKYDSKWPAFSPVEPYLTCASLCP